MSTNLKFTPAKRLGIKIRLAISGPSGSGKTLGALRVARGLSGPAGKIAVIDTEHQSASLYADITPFDTLTLTRPYSIRDFIDAVRAAEAAGYSVLVIDSLSHAWEAVLEYKESLDRRGGNQYTNWGPAGELWREMIEAVLSVNLHVIATMRSKIEYVVEDVAGKKTPKKVGLAPVVRDGTEYEFTLCWDLDHQHNAISTKDRTKLYDQRIVELTEERGRELLAWTNSQPVELPMSEPEAPAAVEQHPDPLDDWLAINSEKVNAYLLRIGWTKEGETWRSLDKHKREIIRRKRGTFAAAAGIEAPKEREEEK